MNKSNEICEVSGRYAAYGPCGHSLDRCVIKGDAFPVCPTCGRLVAWTLLHETGPWGDDRFQVDSPSSRYFGMTINERLWEAQVMDEFQNAKRDCDRQKMISLLQQVGVSLPAAEWTADAALVRRAQTS